MDYPLLTHECRDWDLTSGTVLPAGQDIRCNGILTVRLKSFYLGYGHLALKPRMSVAIPEFQSVLHMVIQFFVELRFRGFHCHIFCFILISLRRHKAVGLHLDALHMIALSHIPERGIYPGGIAICFHDRCIIHPVSDYIHITGCLEFICILHAPGHVQLFLCPG